MKFCNKCGSLYFLKKNADNALEYHCRTCGNYESRDIGDNCIYKSDIGQKDYMTYQISKNPYLIRDPTLPRLSNVKCINTKCMTNHSDKQLILLNSNNTKEGELISYLQTITGDDISVEIVKDDDIVEYGEIHTTLCNLPVFKKELLKTNPVKIFKFGSSVNFQKVVDVLKKENGTSNLIGDKYIIDVTENKPVLSEILREIISIKYDDINMKYMYICSTCGSSWKNIS